MKIEPVRLQRLEDMPFPAVPDTIEAKIALAEQTYMKLFEAGVPVVFPFSGGKDSSVTTSIGLNAARKFAASGGKPFCVATTSNTGVENPEIEALYIQEQAKMRAYAQKHGFHLVTKIVSPTLASTWQVKILSGRGIPSFPNTASDCTDDLKKTPQDTYRSGLFETLKKAGMPDPVQALGTRFDESTRRGNNMRARGDQVDRPVLNKDGHLIICPIGLWEETDVFEYLGMAKNKQFEAYSDFEDTLRVYAHSEGTSCAIVAMAINEDKPKKSGCGARHGCWTCQKAQDKSLENMIEFDPMYEYARGLNKFNKFLRATQNDWSRRNWVGSSIQNGYVEIKPNTYSPAMLRDLTRYLLQIDHDEDMLARREGRFRKFHVLPPEMMVAVDAMQSLRGVAKPFQIWQDYYEITQRGVRYDIPEITEKFTEKEPKARYLYIGEDHNRFGGLRDAYIEAMTEMGNCTPLRTIKTSGKTVWDVRREPTFSVDMESFYMFEDMELPDLLERFKGDYIPGSITEAYKFYVRYGTVALASAQPGSHDDILQRTAHKDRLGLTLNYNVEDLVARSVSFAELDPETQALWMGRKSKKNKAKAAAAAEEAAALALQAEDDDIERVDIVPGDPEIVHVVPAMPTPAELARYEQDEADEDNWLEAEQCSFPGM